MQLAFRDLLSIYTLAKDPNQRRLAGGACAADVCDIMALVSVSVPPSSLHALLFQNIADHIFAVLLSLDAVT